MPDITLGDLGELRSRAHQLAMAPFAFQAAQAARRLGLLASLRRGADSVDALSAATGLPATSVAALLEACLALDLAAQDERGAWAISRFGRVWLADPQVAIDADFAGVVCWHGMADLAVALREARPAGLHHLGPWSTIYEGLAHLPEEARVAWFAYDHGHSDRAFPQAIARLLDHGVRRVLDVGANTGRFAIAWLRAAPDARVTLVDHPSQLALAREALAAAGLDERADFAPRDLLQRTPLPEGHDVVWLSQCLDCFGPEDVTSILSRAAAATRGEVWVLEVCPDRQQAGAAANSLRLASLYFIALANGVSRFYRAEDYIRLAEPAGLTVRGVVDGLGTAHSLLRFGPR